MKPVQTTMPPGQSFARRWAIYAALGAPEIKLDTWRLTTKGLVNKELNLSFEDLQKLPQIKLTKDFHCLLPGSTVIANPEPKPIEQVQVGDHVIGLDGRRHIVRHVLRKHHEGLLFRIKAGYLPSVSLTPDHKVWAVKGHRGIGKTKSQRRKMTFAHDPSPTWTAAGHLRVGDYVYFPKYRQVDRRKVAEGGGYKFRLSKSLAFILGWYVAEGSGGDSEGRVVIFALGENETSQSKKLAETLKRVFGANVSFYSQGHTNRVTVTSSKIRNLPRILKRWCGDDAFTKQIPDFILNARVPVLREFLAALIDGDGYCPWRFDSPRSEMSRIDFLDIATASGRLAYQLILSFSKLGVPAGLVNHPGSVRTAYSVRVSRFDQLSKIFPKEKLPRESGINRRRYWESAAGFFYPITSIAKYHYRGPVFDLTADKFTMLSPFATLDCVTSWSIKDVVWEGVAFTVLAKLTGVKPEAKWVMFHCADGYTAPVPLEDAMVEHSLIAFKMNGKPIPTQQGFPARPFIPHLYGWKSAKWVTGVEFLAEYQDGYWEAFGYHERGNIWDEERFKGQGGKHVRRRGLGTLPI